MNQIRAILLSHLVSFLSSTALLSMAMNAVISTAPTTLPTLRGLPQWAWTWGISALRQFWSLHHPSLPNQPAPEGQRGNQ